MELKKATEEFVKSVNESMEGFKAMAGKAVFDENMEPEYVDTMKNLFKFVDVSMALIEAQSDALQEMNRKLDLLVYGIGSEEES